MRYSPSFIALVLGLGIYATGPFAAGIAYAEDGGSTSSVSSGGDAGGSTSSVSSTETEDEHGVVVVDGQHGADAVDSSSSELEDVASDATSPDTTSNEVIDLEDIADGTETQDATSIDDSDLEDVVI